MTVANATKNFILIRYMFHLNYSAYGVGLKIFILYLQNVVKRCVCHDRRIKKLCPSPIASSGLKDPEEDLLCSKGS